jgi:hypothetical protein
MSRRHAVSSFPAPARLARYAVGLAAVVGLSLGVMPAAASTAADTVTITSVLETSPGVLSIATTSTTPLDGLNVDLTSTAHPNELTFTMADFTLQAGGTDTAGTWTLTTPITDAALPFDTYEIDVSAEDSGGGTAADGQTFLPWVIQPTISVSASQTTYDYNNPDITFSGTLSLVNPDGSAVAASALVGVPLLLTDNYDSNTDITTQAGGAYSVTLTEPDNDAGYTVNFIGTSTTASAQSQQVYVTAVQDPAEVTANVSATQLNYGQKLTITGTAQYNPGTGFVPLANSTVVLYDGPYYETSGPVATTTANAEGQYSFSFADHGPGSWYVYAGGIPGSYFLGQVLTQALAITRNVNVALPVSITKLRVSLSPFAVLTVSGCLIAGESDIPPALPLQVEWAPKPAGPWHVLKTVHGLGDNTCGSGPIYGLPFSYEVPVTQASAYYRLAYKGSSDYLPAVSKAVHESKIVTEITNFTISPRSTARDDYVTVSGRLLKYTNGWHPLARQRVWIIFTYHRSVYYYPKHPLTSSNGSFSGRFQLYVTAPWVAEFLGSNTYFATVSKALKVRVSSAAAVSQQFGAQFMTAVLGGALVVQPHTAVREPDR